MDCELLAPAGDFETALAAFAAGADAVYCGLADYSARAFAKNLSREDLKKLIRFAHFTAQPSASNLKPQTSNLKPQTSNLRPKKVYVTFNTLLDEDAMESAVETLAFLEEAGPDAVIVQDLGVARLCRRHFPGLKLHASTQLVAHNLEGVLALGKLGFTRVVLARELSLEEIASIAKRCGDIELECFIHGALCYSLSGLCLFGAMEKGRSGNRGQCPYCCRAGIKVSTHTAYPFSMKDLRLGEDARKLVEAGVVSLKIEGRMKSPLYVASVTKYYRGILGEGIRKKEEGRSKGVTVSDLETVFSRRTTELYFNARPTKGNQRPALTNGFANSTVQPPTSNLQPSSPIDSTSLGHLGTLIGAVKRVTRDREGRRWLRFHTSRALEKHDGLQFAELTAEGRHLGFGITEMRTAISRVPVFEVAAGTDVEVLLPEEIEELKTGSKIYCSMSNAVKRMFPAPSFRESDYPGNVAIEVGVKLERGGISVWAQAAGTPLPRCEARWAGELQVAKSPEKTREAVERAFAKLGGTDYRLGDLTLDDPEKLFAPASVLNDLRRDLAERLDEARDRARREKIAAALGEGDVSVAPRDKLGGARVLKAVKIRPGQRLPAGDWDEIIVAINHETDLSAVQPSTFDLQPAKLRLSLPVYTAEPEFNKLRSAVKRFVREGYDRWEASDLATLSMLRALGVEDVTADWSLYAFNSHALAALSELGVRRFVASPENGRENLQYLAESGYEVEFLVQQSTPLFISLTAPEAEPDDLKVFVRDGLWVTTRPNPRTFEVPKGASARVDLSWDPQ